MASEDREKMAVITNGFCEYVMPFGLKNAAQTFQRFMDVVLRGLDFAFCYIDDFLIASSNESEYQEHLQKILELLQQYDISINTAKNIGAQSVKYFGQIEKKGAKSSWESKSHN